MNDTPTPKENCETCHGLGRVDAVYAHCPNCVLTAAREELKAVTIERDEFHVKIEELAIKLQATTEQRDEWGNLWADLSRSCVKDLTKLERELTAVTEQRDDFKKELEIANLRLKGKRHPDDNGIMGDGEIDVKAVTEQRDRLAEALRQIASSDPNWRDCLLIAREALQSLNQPEPESKDPHRFCRGGGGNNFHCGCKYDS